MSHTPVLVLPRSRYGRGRKRWLAARAGGIGASEAAAAVDLHPFISRLSLYAAKVNPELPAWMSEAAFWGLELEHTIARVCAKREGLKIKPSPGLLAHPDRPWQLATVDKLVVDNDDQVLGPLEIKTSSAFKERQWPENELPPAHAVLQVQQQCEVGCWRRGWLAALIGGNNYRFWEIDYDPVIAGVLTDAEEELWDRIQRRDPPPPTGHAADEAAIAGLFPPDDELTRISTPYYEDLVRRLKTTRAERARLRKDEQAQRDELAFALGSATALVGVDGQPIATFRPHDQRRVDTTRLRVEMPEIAEKFTVTKPVRTLRIAKETDADE